MLSSDAVLSYQGTIIVAIISLIGILISVCVSYIVVKIQTKSASKDLDRQLLMEVSKMELEYTLKAKNESKIYVNRLLLEKATELQSIFPNWIRMCWRSADRQKDYLKLSNKTKEEYVKMRKDIDEIEQSDLIVYRQVSILFNYFPDLRKEYDKVSLFNTQCFIVELVALLNRVEVTKEEIMELENKIKKFQRDSIKVGELIDLKIIFLLENF